MTDEMDDLDGLLDPHVNSNNSGGNFRQETIPNANAVLVLGICSIVGCFLYFVPGLVCSIIALFLFSGVKGIYNSNTIKYEASYKNAKAGQICAIIGLCLSGLFFLIFLFALISGVTGNNYVI